LKAQFKIFLLTFSLAFVALFIIHLVYLPYYWANASSQRVRPFDLYLPGVWTPAIVFYSVLVGIIAVVTFSLLSWLRKGKPGEASVEGVIFLTTFFVGWLVIWVLFALGPMQFGHTVSLYNYWGPSHAGYANSISTFLLSFVGGFSSVAVFEFYKAARCMRKRSESKAET
jgi:hypothetical protein